MELFVNRYYKSDKKGYCFLSEKGIFADESIRDGIEKKIIAEVVGNKSINAWIGGVVFDVRRNPYYVFGHNVMSAQEKNSSRLSVLYTFAVIPFEELRKISVVQPLMREITMLESQNNFKKDTILISESSLRSDGGVERRMVAAMIAGMIDPDIRLDIVDVPDKCRMAIEVVLNRWLFPERMPYLVYLDRGKQDTPQCGWTLQDNAVSIYTIGNSSRMDQKTPEQSYLLRAGQYILGKGNQSFRRLFTREHYRMFCEDMGRQNDSMLIHAMIWYYALNQAVVDALPTEEEKQYMLRKIK